MTPQSTRKVPWRIVIAAGVVLVGFLAWHYVVRKPDARDSQARSDPEPDLPAPDPRLSYRGPFKNVHPAVPYVSDATCAKCHLTHVKRFSQHPMARTLMPVSRASFPSEAKQHAPFTAFGQEFKVENRDGRVWHTRSAAGTDGKPLFRAEQEVHFVIGSGTRAHSFLSLQDGTFLQTPITWYSQKKILALSPGFKPIWLAGRRVGADCLFCHSNGAAEDPKEETHYLEPVFPHGHGIGCQRCHGPGDEHVKDPGRMVATGLGILDPTIVNPAHLPPALRESVCWQCHLEGAVRVLRRGRERFDFRPGMPLEDFVGVFDDPGHASFDHVVNHVEQMQQSRCYVKSAGPGQMGCVSCHDPHETPAPENRVAFYRNACLKCHQTNGCSVPAPVRSARQKDDSCIACHMPRFGAADASHVSSTDHRVPRRQPAAKGPANHDSGAAPLADLRSLFEQHRGRRDPELDRDRALAAYLLARRGRPVLQPLHAELEAAVRRDPGDIAVKAQLGLDLINQGRTDRAIELLEDVLARQPDHEFALFGLAVAYGQADRIDDSLGKWRRLVKMAPSQWGFRLGLAEQLAKAELWEEALDHGRAWAAYVPGSPDARAFLRFNFTRLGRTVEADEQDRIFRELEGRSKKP